MKICEYIQPEKAEWRTIPGWDKYQVSSTGRVRNATTYKILKQWKHTGKGTTYKRITLSQDGRRWGPRVHRLVAMAFLPKPDDPELNEVDHIDHNSFNNRADNLRWISGEENRQHMRAYHALRKEREKEKLIPVK